MCYTTMETLYKYTVRNGQLFINEGNVIIDNGREYVYFEDTHSRVRCPMVTELGIVQTSGPSLWLTNRDDNLAKRLFIEFEEYKLTELRKQIMIKTALIEMLKKDLA